MQPYHLYIRQLDALLAESGIAERRRFLKRSNWFQVTREALGMSMRYIASKMHLSPGRIAQLQSAEQDGSITLRNLQKLAEAVECELVYEFVPKLPSLQKTLEQQAKKQAKKQLERVHHSMVLEDQATAPEDLKLQYEALVQRLMEQHPRHLWK